MLKDKKPVIGITMSLDDYNFIRPGIDYSFIRREYGEMIRRAGGHPIFLDPAISPEAAAEICDGIVISGGEDIDPELYDEDDRSGALKEPIIRTSWEQLLIDACDSHNVPIFGICYGCQLLNVHYGGSLYQDINKEHASDMYHGSSDQPAHHEVTFTSKFMGFEMGDQTEIISRHHQAVKRLAPGFRAIGVAPDGVVEAIASDRQMGVQWHPESDETGERLYRSFVEHCQENMLSIYANSAYNLAYERVHAS